MNNFLKAVVLVLILCAAIVAATQWNAAKEQTEDATHIAVQEEEIQLPESFAEGAAEVASDKSAEALSTISPAAGPGEAAQEDLPSNKEVAPKVFGF